MTGTSLIRISVLFLASFLFAGRGSAHVVSIDATPLSMGGFILLKSSGAAQTGLLNSKVVQTLDLPADTYRFQIYSGIVADFTFSVTSAGQISHSSSFDGFLEVQNGTTLRIEGWQIELDATSLSSTGLLLLAFDTLFLDSTVPQTLRLPPFNAYRFVLGPALFADFTFGVAVSDGAISYPASDVGFLTVIDSTTLKILGFEIAFDATALSSTSFFDAGLNGLRNQPVDTTVSHILTLLPLVNNSPNIGYRMVVGSGRAADFAWNIDKLGNVYYCSDYNPQTSSCSPSDHYLSGRGLPELTVHGHSISVDATNLGSGVFQFLSLRGVGPLDRSVVQTLQVVPTVNGYDFHGGGVHFNFDVTDDGLLAYSSDLDSLVSGRGTDKLIVGTCIE